MGIGNRTVDVPVGVERVLFLAAVNEDFRAKLLEDREAALQEFGLKIRPTEAALLRAIPATQLQQNIDGIDTSEQNLERRSFLQAVAASAAVVAAGGAAGCGDDGDKAKVDADMGAGDRGVRPDTLPVKEQGVMKDAGAMPDTVPVPDHSVVMDGISPDMPGPKPDTVPWKNDGQGLPDAGILPDMPKPDGA